MADWFMYVLECSDGSFYCGVTTDIERRVNEHNSPKSKTKYTRTRRPVKLVYSEPQPSKSDAFKAEYAFKKLSRAKKKLYCNIDSKLLR